MQSSTVTPNYTDFNGLQSLRTDARNDPRATLGKVAKQFEGLFIQMMMKSMRDASMGDPIFDSDQSKFYREMFDQQVALDLSEAKGIGLADALVRQLGGNLPQGNSKTVTKRGNILPFTDITLNNLQGTNTVSMPGKTAQAGIDRQSDNQPFQSHEDFASRLMPYAEKAAEELGISPLVLIAQAALETGWGKSVIQHGNGASSHNLFNIKASTDWKGEKVVKSSLEYKNGIANLERSAFRAYDSYAESFADYVNFIKSNDRYGKALEHQGDDHFYISALQNAGYATDPRYADKINNVMQREVIQQQVLDVGENQDAII